MPVHCVVGMAGSGKSHYLKEWALKGWLVFDDIRKCEWAQLPEARKAAELGHQVMISDVEFCTELGRDELMGKLPVSIDQWICFANDPEQCRANCKRRAREKPERRKSLARELERIDFLAARYTVPENAKLIDVYRPPAEA